MLGSLLIFTVGSAVCGAAPSLNVLIAGRSAYKQSPISFVTRKTILNPGASRSDPRTWRWRHIIVDGDHTF
jgi:hypothetical protein